MGDPPARLSRNNSSHKATSESGDDRHRDPDSSGKYTRVFPARSLLGDVQPDDDNNPRSPSLKHDNLQFITDNVDSSSRNEQRRRTAQWQASMALPRGTFSRSIPTTSPSNVGSPGILSPTGTGQPFFTSSSFMRAQRSGASSQAGRSDRAASTSSSKSGFAVVSDDEPGSAADNEQPAGVPSPEDDSGEGQRAAGTTSQQRDQRSSLPPGSSEDASDDNPQGSSSAAPSNNDQGLNTRFAANGYVHLGPAESWDDHNSSGRASSKSNPLSRSSRLSRGQGRLGSILSPGPNGENLDERADSSASNLPGSSELSRNAEADVSSDALSISSAASYGQFYKTDRFQHVETEDGHHLLLGRDSQLERCEDEPIRTPGAVQGFGVLIAVEEDYESGNLIVRQVSENCTEILGLTPHYLFSLECFSHTLPPSQADILWDNLQYLNEPDEEQTGLADEGPQVFLISGYGQPGSAIRPNYSSAESGEDAEGGNVSSSSAISKTTSQGSSAGSPERRQWTCWCAAHRSKPPRTQANQASQSQNSFSSDDRAQPADGLDGEEVPPNPSLIILEFELEMDLYNPLYPPPDARAGPAGSTSPGNNSDGSGRGSGTDSTGSDKTAMPGSTQTVTPGEVESATPRAVVDGKPVGGTSPADGVGAGPVANYTPDGTIENTDPNQSPAANPGLSGEQEWTPSAEAILQSTTNKARPIRALERMRRLERTAMQRSMQRTSERGRRRGQRGFGQAGSGTLDVFAVLAQVNEQLSAAPDLQSFLDVAVGIMKDLTQFHRVLIYQFDESANGQVVAELVDWSQTHDLYRGLHFPAADIPAQARDLYKINKVRSLYDRGQTTARLVGRTRADVEHPLDLTHSYLRAMSPIHLKYLANMGVRGSMSISIVSFGELWGLICCHSYGGHGMRVSFPVRQMLRLLSDSISRNVERLSYAQRLQTRKLINTIPTDAHPTGHIVSNAEDLLSLFDADFGVLVIGEGAKILGPNESGQDVLIIAEYLRLKQFKLMQVSQDISKDFPDIDLHAGLNVIAGVLYVPLSSSGRDFIAFLRRGQLREVTWAGRPTKPGTEEKPSLEPRASFQAWSETIATRCRAWTDEQLETAGVLALVYGKFIEVWRQKETAMKTTQLTNLLLSNASHEVRTPLNHIINYLELALNGPLDKETRDNLSMSHTASKNLLFTINDLLDLTRLESGNETSFNEPFDFHNAIDDAVSIYRTEARRRDLDFIVDVDAAPKSVIGDSKKIKTVVANLTANAVKFTDEGHVSVEAKQFNEPAGLRAANQAVVEIIVGDTGRGIESEKLESIFREFEQVEQSGGGRGRASPGLGLGLAVVARIVEQLGGQLRVDSKPGEGSRFSFLIPFTLPSSAISPSAMPPVTAPSVDPIPNSSSPHDNSGGSRGSSRALSMSSSAKGSEIDSFVEAISASSVNAKIPADAELRAHTLPEVAVDKRTDRSTAKARARATRPMSQRPKHDGEIELGDSNFPLRSVRLDPFDIDKPVSPSRGSGQKRGSNQSTQSAPLKPTAASPSVSKPTKEPLPQPDFSSEKPQYRVLIVEDDAVNRNVLQKRLKLDGHTVVTTNNGQEAVDVMEKDRNFDCILMDIQMPILNGFGATRKIREVEKANPLPLDSIRPSNDLNGGIPIFAVSASLRETQRQFMIETGMDAWILKPINYKRLGVLMNGITNLEQRAKDLWTSKANWEAGGWMRASVVQASEGDTA